MIKHLGEEGNDLLAEVLLVRALLPSQHKNAPLARHNPYNTPPRSLSTNFQSPPPTLQPLRPSLPFTITYYPPLL